MICCCCSAVFAELSFTCMVGLTNALEQDGYIKGFMDFYLRKVQVTAFAHTTITHAISKCTQMQAHPRINTYSCTRLAVIQKQTVSPFVFQGEPYLSTSYAIMMSYWDGTVHFSLQLLMVRRMAQG